MKAYVDPAAGLPTRVMLGLDPRIQADWLIEFPLTYCDLWPRCLDLRFKSEDDAGFEEGLLTN